MSRLPLPPPLDLSQRLLCGPGPTNFDPRVLEAMQRPLLGYLDPEFVQVLDEIESMLRTVFGRSDGLALPLSSTGTAGMEAGVAALVEPGETVVVGVAGYFGSRMAEIARRHGARVVEVCVSPGEHVPSELLVDALKRDPAVRAVFLVHAETSTGVRQPVEELAQALAESEALLVVDCVTSLGGIEVELERWGVDYCYSCSQKCLGAPPGLAPVWLSERALERLRARKEPLPFTFDFELLAHYWTERPPVYHHTAPALLLYALHEALRLVLDEGLEARHKRHTGAGAYLQSGLYERGFELLADERFQLPQLSAVRVPGGVDGMEVRRRLLQEHGIEIGGALDPGSAPIWRIGLMGGNATIETANRVLSALDAALTTTAALSRS